MLFKSTKTEIKTAGKNNFPILSTTNANIIPADVRVKLVKIGELCAQAKLEVNRLEELLRNLLQIKNVGVSSSSNSMHLSIGVEVQKVITNLKVLLRGLDKANPELNELQNSIQSLLALQKNLHLSIGLDSSSNIGNNVQTEDG